MNDLTIRTLALGSHQANACLLYREGRTDALLIDPGDDLDVLEQALTVAQRTLTDILLTHGHFDHILAAAPLARKYGARVHVHPLDAHMLLTPGDALYNPAWCHLPFEPLRADAPFPTEEGSWPLEVCGVSFEGFHTPGHTPGSVCLLDREHGALFTGDTIFAYGYGRTDFPGGNDDAMRASILRLLGMDRSLTVYSGHGEADSLDAIARRWGR